MFVFTRDVSLNSKTKIKKGTEMATQADPIQATDPTTGETKTIVIPPDSFESMNRVKWVMELAQLEKENADAAGVRERRQAAKDAAYR